MIEDGRWWGSRVARGNATSWAGESPAPHQKPGTGTFGAGGCRLTPFDMVMNSGTFPHKDRRNLMANRSLLLISLWAVSGGVAAIAQQAPKQFTARELFYSAAVAPKP